MVEHIELSDIPEFCLEKKWLKARYGEEEGNKLWELINRQYDKYLEDLPDYPPVEELQELVTNYYVRICKIGKVF